MKTYKDFLGKCYLETTDEYFFCYKIIERNGVAGIECYETQAKPSAAFAYTDFEQEGEDGFIDKFIPDLNPEISDIKEITEEKFKELATRVEFLKDVQTNINNEIRMFTIEIWTGAKNTKK